MEPTFPLFRLPENVVVRVLRRMDYNQLLVFSLVSTKAKRLVTSLRIRTIQVSITIFRRISVKVYTLKNDLIINFYYNPNDPNADLPADIFLPVAAHFENEDRTLQSSTPFNFIDWLSHIKTVFCYTDLPNVYFYEGCERFDVQSLENGVGDVDVLVVSNLLPNAVSRKVLKDFKTFSKLIMGKNPFDETCEVQKHLIQNFEAINFKDLYSLDDMLLINSKEVKFCRPIPHKQFNHFVKHWIRGSNLRLQDMGLLINNTNPVSRDMLLKGIHCFGVARREQLEISRKHGVEYDYMVEIRRKDGTRAVITTKKLIILSVRFLVF